MKGRNIRMVWRIGSSTEGNDRAELPSISRFGLLFAVTAILVVAVFYLWSNIDAPMQRDGAHFVFMANNIAHGQPPYWASFETKNPMVEIFWSLFIWLLAKSIGIVEAVRVAETFWVMATSILIFLVVSSIFPMSRKAGGVHFGPARMWPALAVALLYLVLALDVRVADDGLNIALYQSLPELALVALLVRAPNGRYFAHGGLVGVLVFLAWFVKQTSLLPAFLILVGYAFIQRRKLRPSWWAGLCLGAIGGVTSFVLHLIVTGTLDNYLLGTTIYRSGIAPALASEFLANARAAYSVPLWSLTLGQFLAAHRVWTAIALILLMPLATIYLYRSRENSWGSARLALFLSVCWMVGAWLQAVLALTFFPHYFLASLAPVAVVIGVLISMSSRLVAFILSAGVLSLFSGLVGSYADMKASNTLRGETAPINLSTAQVLHFIRPGERVFNWSGLPHVLVAQGAPSAYPLNMCWPFIMTGLPDDTRKRMLKDVLRIPPDVVVAMNEHYPANQGISNYSMNESLLKEFTGQDYVLVYRTSQMPGRYGDPVSVFRLKSELTGTGDLQERPAR